MNISSAQPTIATQQPSAQPQPTATEKQGAFETEKRVSDNVTISEDAKRFNDKMQDIANKYDVTNMSTTERIAMAQELNDSQLMPDGVMLAMVAPLSMNEDVDQKTDYLNTMRESFAFLSKMGGNSEQLELTRKQLDLLEHLNSLSS